MRACGPRTSDAGAVDALLDYDITDSVDEVAMHSQFLENRAAIIAEGVDPLPGQGARERCPRQGCPRGQVRAVPG